MRSSMAFPAASPPPAMILPKDMPSNGTPCLFGGKSNRLAGLCRGIGEYRHPHRPAPHLPRHLAVQGESLFLAQVPPFLDVVITVEDATRIATLHPADGETVLGEERLCLAHG